MSRQSVTGLKRTIDLRARRWLFLGLGRGIPPDLESRLFRKLQMIDDATTDQDLRVPPATIFEKLRGHLDGFHSIRVNKQWRLIFQSDGGKAS